MATKEETLKKNNCFNGNFENVSADIFNAAPFFDKKDIVQVKYEMVRAASNGEGSITDIADNFGFSRKSFYQISSAFDAGGLHALVPKKTGPKKAHKLNAAVQEFIEAYLSTHKDAKAAEITAALEDGMKVRIHPRTIYRYLKKN
jgi:transposase